MRFELLTMGKLALSIPGFADIDSEKINGTPVPLLPKGVPTGGIEMGNNILVTFIELIFVGAILFSLFSLIRGGINIITSGGQKEKFQQGRERVRYAIIGLAVVFSSLLLISIIGSFFGINFLKFSP